MFTYNKSVFALVLINSSLLLLIGALTGSRWHHRTETCPVSEWPWTQVYSQNKQLVAWPAQCWNIYMFTFTFLLISIKARMVRCVTSKYCYEALIIVYGRLKSGSAFWKEKVVIINTAENVELFLNKCTLFIGKIIKKRGPVEGK